MNPTLLRALFALLPASALFAGALLYVKAKSPRSWLQLLGAGGLLLVILVHVCEGLQVLPWMGWGLEHSAGHYIDLFGALLAFTLFPAGYLLHALGRSNT
jgi:succinate dehydrogenase/fumarate reductase cytochrome b subunit